ncbi:PstS family phosphate ABC transporter substrate-binding protein [Sphingobacterium psychroaquaticum]|uniref:Phosphate transport system substrate-binding protein n=1 Tax=Sphingobacterium psychroaquaticum TaxID=561061 RepID=A0A1X7L1Z4_9SPHI|nr:substrate-binding domain-containing protein [Sphingobacterium psychroaquaticum]SMG47695.1 phosphate transport system substrate-binding protein [Sphingobacterium psychroaquaticum]
MKRYIYGGMAALLLMTTVGCFNTKNEGQSNVDSTAAPKGGSKEDILVGTLNVVVDASIFPLMREQEEVFLAAYPNAKLNIIVKPEVLAVKELLADKATVAVLARELNEKENEYFANRSIKPRVFPVWSDAVVFVGNTKSADTSVTIPVVLDMMKGQNANNKKLIFDNLNSSSFRQLQELGKIEKVASNFVEGVGDARGVLNTVMNNSDRIGVISYNEYLDLESSFSNNIRILSVKNTIGEKADNMYYKPNQSTIAAEQYPLRRTFYVLNYQPNMGLGIGFSAFLTGDRGQRIVLKSGLVPASMPGREIIIRDNI